MSSQDLSWNQESSRFSELSHVQEMNAQWKDMCTTPEIGWENSRKGAFFSAEDSDDQRYMGPTRRYMSQESVGLKPRSHKSPRANPPSQPLQLTPEICASHKETGHLSQASQLTGSRHNYAVVLDGHITLSTPRLTRQPTLEDTDPESSSEHDPKAPSLASRALLKPSERNAFIGQSTFRLNRHLSADYVPSSLQGEKDSKPSIPRAAPVRESNSQVGEMVPETPETSMDASRPTNPSSSQSNKSSSGKSPAVLGLVNAYVVTPGRLPEALPAQGLSGVRQRPYYP